MPVTMDDTQKYTDKLALLTTLSKQLAEQSDQLNRTIETMDQQLAAATPGVSAWLPQHQLGSGYVLGYTKLGDRWTLAVYQKGITADDLPPIALRNAPRAVRVEAVALFGPLLDALIVKTEALVMSVKQAL